ncbi:hypothetical protein, partial [Candidatus Megaera venefica]|uniref:hypothetical protein n=1 Tax=Candidatus Megaera venefica TaxID=2055910 RepID=UPI002AD2D8A2
MAIFFHLLFQNFLFTSNFELYSIRSGDGASFHAPLRKVHDYFVNFKLDSLFKNLYYFGYNWLFWFSLGLVTLPLYLIGNEQLLIIAPCIIMQLYIIGCFLVFYKVIGLFSKDKLLNYLILFIALSFPSSGFFSLHFYCIAAPAFFMLLSIYFMIKSGTSNERKNLFLAA